MDRLQSLLCGYSTIPRLIYSLLKFGVMYLLWEDANPPPPLSRVLHLKASFENFPNCKPLTKWIAYCTIHSAPVAAASVVVMSTPGNNNSALCEVQGQGPKHGTHNTMIRPHTRVTLVQNQFDSDQWRFKCTLDFKWSLQTYSLFPSITLILYAHRKSPLFFYSNNPLILSTICLWVLLYIFSLKMISNTLIKFYYCSKICINLFWVWRKH